MARLSCWILLLCLQNCLEAGESDTDILTVYGILGEQVTFPLNIPESENIAHIAWGNSKTSVALVQAPRSKGAAPHVTVTHQNYFDRINVSRQNYNLQISNLRMEDAQTYRADININININKNMAGRTTVITVTKSYQLEVYGRLGKPTIAQSLMTSMNGTCNVTLTCSVEKEGKDVTYRWQPLGGDGHILQVSQDPAHGELTYTCIASNPVSNSSASISAQQLCTDVTVGLRPHHAGLLAGLAVLSLLILVLLPVLLLFLYKRGQDGDLSVCDKDTLSKNTIYTYVKAPRDTQTDDGRIYDEISPVKGPPAKEKPEHTIYSTVQCWPEMKHAGTQDRKLPGTSS